MRKIVFAMILLSLSFAAAADIQRRIYFFTQQSNYLRQACYTQRGDFLNDTVLFDPASSIAETTIDCNAQAVALNQELDAIQTEVQRLGGDNCELEIVDDSLIDLLNGGTGIADEMNCPGIGSAGQCAAVMGCNLMSGIIPFGGRIAQMALRNHPTLNQCAASGTNCFENIGAAIGHNLFDTLSGLCYLATFGYACGPDEEPDPDGESRNRALAAQSQDDESVASFSSDPIGWLYNMGNSILDMITQAITERYGCRQWTGAPFVSECAMPMNWDCATCDQKLNMVCGTVGYVGAEIITLFLSGGTTGAVKALGTSLRGVRAVSQVGDYVATSRAARLIGRAGTASARRLGSVWNGIANSRIAQGVRAAAGSVASGASNVNRTLRRNVRVFSASQDFMIAAARGFNQISEAAFMAGYRSTANIGRQSSARILADYPTLASIRSGAFASQGIRTPDDYLRVATRNLPPGERERYVLTITSDRPQRVILSDTRAVDITSNVRFDFNPQAVTPAPRVPPPAMRRPEAAARVDEVPGEPIVVSGNLRNVDQYPIIEASTRSQNDLIRAFGGDTPYNRQLATLARDEYRLPGSFEGAAYDLHDAWMAANPQLRATRPQAFLDYDDLPAAEKLRYADELQRAFQESNPALVSSRGFQEYRASLNGTPTPVPAPVPAGATVTTRVDDAPISSGGITVGGTVVRNGDAPVVATRVTPVTDANPTRVTNVTTGRAAITTSTDGEAAIARVLGDHASYQDREIVLDILLGGQRRDAYFNGRSARPQAFQDRYRELERSIRARGDRAILEADVRALTAERIAVGNERTLEELTDLSRSRVRHTPRDVDCRAFANIAPGAFPAEGRCKGIRFDQEVNGRYCSCGAMNKTSFTWLVRCPTSTSDFRSLATYVDELALPHDSAPEMCTRVDIPRGKECYLGPTSATFAGFGGTTQLLCEGRAPDPNRGNFAAASADIERYGLDIGGQSVVPVRWSPFSTFPEYQRIIDRASRACTNVCDINELRLIEQEFSRSTAAIRARGNPRELERLAIEQRDFAQYMRELREGRRTYPTSEIMASAVTPATRASDNLSLTAPVVNPGVVDPATTVTTRLPGRSTRADNVTRASQIASRRGVTLEEAVRRNTAIPDTPQGLAQRRSLIAQDFPHLTPAQLDALVNDVHRIGAETIAAGRSYSPTELLAKQRRMRELGISDADADALLRLGYTGSGNRPVTGALDPAMVRIAEESSLGSGPASAARADELTRELRRTTDPARARTLEAEIITERRRQGVAFALAADETGSLQLIQGATNGFAASGNVDATAAMMRASLNRGVTPDGLRQGVEARIILLQSQRVAGQQNMLIDSEILTLRDALTRVAGNPPSVRRTVAAESVTPIPTPSPSLNGAQLRARSEAADRRARDLRGRIDGQSGNTDELVTQYQQEVRNTARDLEASGRASGNAGELREAAQRYSEAGDVARATELLEEAIQLRRRSGVSVESAASQAMEDNVRRMNELYREIGPGRTSGSPRFMLTRETELENLREVNRNLAERLSTEGRTIRPPLNEPLPTPYSLTRVTPARAATRGQELAAARQFDSASLYYQRAISRRSFDDVNYTGSLSTSMQGSGRVLEDEFRRALDPRSGVRPEQLVTALHLRTDWRMLIGPNRTRLHNLLTDFQRRQPRIGSLTSGNTVERRQLEEMIRLTSPR